MTPVPKEPEVAVLALEGREVRVTHPDKLYFSRQARLTKLDLVRYFLSIAPGALAGIRDRPLVLKRFVDGAEGVPFYQKRAPSARPEWLRTVTLAFPSGRTAEELVIDDAAGLAFVVNLGCIELHPHPVRTGNLDHPDELRIDLDPTPGVAWADLRRAAVEARALAGEGGLLGLFGAPTAGCTRLGAARLGGGPGVRAGGFYGIDHAGALRCDRRSACRHRRRCGLAGEAARTRRAGRGARPR